MAKQMKPYTINPDGSVEWQCLYCSEPILIYKGDAMTVVVGEVGMVDGILCTVCAKRRDSVKEATDGR